MRFNTNDFAMGLSARYQSTHIDTFVALLLRLHELIRQGKGDDPEADEVRDQMDEPWRHLNMDGRLELMDGLSADLYSIGVDRQQNGSLEAEEWNKMQQAINAEQWDAVLDLVREHEAKLPPDEVSGLRGICWQALGQQKAATAFFDEAVRINPRAAKFEIPRLCLLIRSGRIEEAVALAQAMPLDAWSKYIFTQPSR